MHAKLLTAGTAESVTGDSLGPETPAYWGADDGTRVRAESGSGALAGCAHG